MDSERFWILSEEKLYIRDDPEGHIIDGQLIEAERQGPAPLEPAHCPLNAVAPPWTRPTAAAARDFFFAPAAAVWARLMVPSKHHRSRSMKPALSSCRSRASRMLAQVPSFRQRLKRS